MSVLAALIFCTVAAAASTPPKIEIVPADQTWAESIVLASTDLGAGWTAGSSGGGGASGSGDAGGACAAPDESDLTLTGVSDSPNFHRSSGSAVSSHALIWKTAEQAQADWDRHVQPALLNCLAAGAALASTKKVKLVVTGKRQLAYPAVAPRTAAYRISFVYKATVKVKKRRRKVRVPATLDFVALGNGRATAMLIVASLNARPLTESYKQSLATLIAQRMATDPNPNPTP